MAVTAEVQIRAGPFNSFIVIIYPPWKSNLISGLIRLENDVDIFTVIL